MTARLPYPLLLIALALVAMAFGVLSMLVGAGGGPAEIMTMMDRGDADLAWTIIGEVRLPRTLLALMVGGTLGMAFGVTSSSLLVAVGSTPVAASAAVHFAELGTTFASGDLRSLRWTRLRVSVPWVTGMMR